MRTHTKTFHIRFTEKECERLCKYAATAGLPKTTYIRHMINGLQPKECPKTDYYEFMRELYRLGNNVNQLAFMSHKFGSLHTARLEETNEALRKLILLITKQMIAPDKVNKADALERGRLLAEEDYTYAK